jgi:hypothetical protein
MAGTVSLTNIAPVWPVWNDTLLGFIDTGGATLNVTSEWSEIQSSQTGTYLLDAVFNGARLTVAFSLMQFDDADIQAVAWPFGESQVEESTPPLERFAFTKAAEATAGDYVGNRLSNYVQELKLIPVTLYSAPGTDTGQQVIIPKAWCRETGEVAYSETDKKVVACTFEAQFDPDATLGTNLGFIGLEDEVGGTWTAA